ncbi:MAG: HprK-related kinase B [Gammaproteobacteria bacterium]|nr:MAG: HprK-related kinase B [Gammaproteobacteria bacterium]
MDTNSIAQIMQGDETLCDDDLYLGLGECVLRIRSNSPALIRELAAYFSHVAITATDSTMDVIAIEGDPPELGIEYIDWKREPGKTGRKDAYAELTDGRLVYKVRTGMVFLQSENYRIAAGPCIKYNNQVINFINSQYMNWLQHRGWLICHASGLVYDGKCLGIAGFSGGGKSTLMLHMLDNDEVSYLTNDRLFVKVGSGQTLARGIPKLPRINPGTIVHNAKLHDLISSEKREELLRLPPEELWHIEDKYDVHIDHVYGSGRIVEQAPITSFLILNWTRDSDEETTIEKVDLGERRDLLGALMKSPGPFYQFPDGSFQQDDSEFDEDAYLHELNDVAIYEARGRIDFATLIEHTLGKIMI